MLTGTNLKYAKSYNVRLVLEMIRIYGPLSRVQIARRTELTAQTVSNITRQLIKAGLILESDRLQEGRGAPAILLKLNPDGVFAIGLDLDKDHLTGILVDLLGNVRRRVSVELNFPLPDEAMDLLEKTVTELIAAEGIGTDRIAGVGVGVPGPLGVSKGSVITNVVNPKAFPGWQNVPVADILNARLSLPVVLENNASAAAIGERWYGAGQHINTFFYVFFSTGLGGGMIINGQPYEGHMGNAGEIGYLPVAGEEPPSPSLGKPHVGQYFNLPHLYERLNSTGSSVSRPSDLADVLEAGHPELLRWLDEAAERLAPVVLAIEHILDPDAIFFGGRLPVELIEVLIQRLGENVANLHIENGGDSPSLILATAGEDAAALGVATLPLYTTFAPIPKLLMKRSNPEPASLLTQNNHRHQT